MLMIQQFMAISEEERIEAGNQMDGREKNQIMLGFARMNTSINWFVCWSWRWYT